MGVIGNVLNELTDYNEHLKWEIAIQDPEQQEYEDKVREREAVIAAIECLDGWQ